MNASPIFPDGRQFRNEEGNDFQPMHGPGGVVPNPYSGLIAAGVGALIGRTFFRPGRVQEVVQDDTNEQILDRLDTLVALLSAQQAEPKQAEPNKTLKAVEQEAKAYLDSQPFSRSGLIKQLVEFDGFTQEQAAHGATSVGL